MAASISWIKITTNIFDDEKILLIESLPEADSIIVIWFKLLTLAGKCNNNGILMLNDSIPYTEEMLSTIFRRPLNTVRLALDTFEKFGMIVTLHDTITIPNWEKHQQVESLDKIREQTRIRVQKYRMKQLSQVIGEKMCSYCGEPATGVDHIIPVVKGGSDEDYNLTPCCIRCNKAKNDKDLAHFLNTHDYVDKKLVLSNEKLLNFINYDYEKNQFVTLQPLHETQQNKNKKENKNNKFKYICPESIELCELLINYCKRDNPNFSKTTNQINKWTNDIGAIYSLDGYSWEDIKIVIDFAKNDGFWNSNILSGEKLRKQMDQLYLKAKNNIQTTKSNWYDSKNIGKAESDRFTESVNESDIPF